MKDSLKQCFGSTGFADREDPLVQQGGRGNQTMAGHLYCGLKLCATARMHGDPLLHDRRVGTCAGLQLLEDANP